MANDSTINTISGIVDEYDSNGQRKDKPTMDFVLRTFLQVEDPSNNPISLALERDDIEDMATLVMLNERAIDSLRWPTTGPNNRQSLKELPLGQKLLLNAFTKFALYLRSDNGGALSNNSWFQHTRENFDEWRSRPIDMLQEIVTISQPNQTTTAQRNNTTPPQRGTSTTNPANEFAKSIKRDKTHYTELKDEKHWDKWLTGFVIQATAHGVEHMILDHKYKPSTPEDIAVFQEKQKFMMSVFRHCLKSDKGKDIIRENMTSGDAQKVYKELMDHMSTSTGARITSAQTVAYLVKAVYDLKTWTHEAQSFILHWTNQARINNEMVPVEKRFHPSVLVTLLQKAVKGVEELRSVATTAEVASRGNGIRRRGAMDLLISDSAKSETSKKVKDILRAYRIHDFQSEPDHQNQNTTERHIQRLKNRTTPAPENVRDAMCWKIGDKEMERIVHRSDVRPADDAIRLEPEKGENAPIKKVVRDRRDVYADKHDGFSDPSTTISSPVFAVDDLIGRTFLMDADSDTNEHFRGKIKRVVTTHGDPTPENTGNLEFLVEVNGSKTDEPVTYKEVLGYINKQSEEPTDQGNPEAQFKFNEILGHEEPLHPGVKHDKIYNVLMNWCSGERTMEPLNVIGADDPVTSAIYAQKHNLLFKHDERHRARFVAGGHLTEIPLESCYSGVISMEDVRTIVFLAELNQLELWGADISSAYLLVDTKPKVFIVTGPEFGDKEGHILFIVKAQYGLRTNGVPCHEQLFFDVLKDIGFTLSLVPDVYMKRNTKPDGTEVWEYVASWEHTVYARAKKQVPHNAPDTLGKSIVLTSFVDANLEHCILTGRAVTGVLEMLNGTPVGWYSKGQSPVETTTYGSEIVAARTTYDRTIDKRTRQRYLGVPIKHGTYLFGDNHAVVDMKYPHSKLTKRHHILLLETKGIFGLRGVTRSEPGVTRIHTAPVSVT